MALDRNRVPPEVVDHLGRNVIARHRPQEVARRVGHVGSDHVGVQRQGDLARHAPHRLGGIERRAQGPADPEQHLGLTQAHLLVPSQLGSFGLRALAAGDVAEDRQVAAGDEPRSGVVLDGPALAIRTDHPELAHLLAGLQEVQPGGVQVEAGFVEEVVEPLAEQIIQRQPEQPARRGIGVDESPRVVDDKHGVPGG